MLRTLQHRRALLKCLTLYMTSALVVSCKTTNERIWILRRISNSRQLLHRYLIRLKWYKLYAVQIKSCGIIWNWPFWIAQVLTGWLFFCVSLSLKFVTGFSMNTSKKCRLLLFGFKSCETNKTTKKVKLDFELCLNWVNSSFKKVKKIKKYIFKLKTYFRANFCTVQICF